MTPTRCSGKKETHKLNKILRYQGMACRLNIVFPRLESMLVSVFVADPAQDPVLDGGGEGASARDNGFSTVLQGGGGVRQAGPVLQFLYS